MKEGGRRVLEGKEGRVWAGASMAWLAGVREAKTIKSLMKE